MPIKLWLALGMAAILASGVGYSLFLRHQVSEYRSENKALTEALAASERELSNQIKLRRADALSSTVKQDTIKAVEQKEAKGRAETERAIANNPDWANTPVPDDILSSLRS